MERQSSNFTYNAETGECEPPLSVGHGLAVAKAQEGSSLLGQVGGVQHEPHCRQTPRRDRNDRKVEAIYGLLKENFYKGTTARGTGLLVNRRTLLATPVEAHQLVSTVQSLAYHATGLAIKKGDIEKALGVIEGDAADVPNLLATIGLAVTGEQGQLFLITPGGVIEILPNGGYYCPDNLQAAIGFVRLSSAKLPCYQAFSGQVSCQPLLDLLKELNVPKGSLLLVITWLIASLHPEADNVLLEIVGERYSGKSSLQTVLKVLIDPSLELLSEDTPATAKKAYEMGRKDNVISLDKVESLTQQVQAALLSLLKGKLTDIGSSRKAENTNVYLSHPIVLNSSESVVTWPDLADRSVLVQLPRLENIKENLVISLRNQGAFELAFASLVELLARAHGRWKSITPTTCPAGMIDFYRIGIAVAEALGASADDFDQQIRGSMERRFALELDEHPVALAVRDLLGASGEDYLDIPVGQLLERLNDYRPEHTEDKDWLRNARHLGAKLDSCNALMEAHGMQVGPAVKKGKHGVFHRRIEKCTPQLYRQREASLWCII